MTAGQSGDPSGSVRIVRVMVQDARDALNRTTATDLLDLNPPVSCDLTHPCKEEYAFAGGRIDVTCRNGFCNDPMAVPKTGVPVNPNRTVKPPKILNGGGSTIRIVFNKLLDSTKIETIAPKDATGNVAYTFKDGVVELLGPDGKPVTKQTEATPCTITTATDSCEILYDGTGAPDFTSDPVLEPFGPAIRITPASGLELNTTYKVVVHAALISDRNGNGLDGGDFTVSFTTEATAADETLGSFTDNTFPGAFDDATLVPNYPIQLAFKQPVDATTFTYTLTGPVTNSGAEVYADNGADPTMCAINPQQINIVPVSAPGTPVNWPAGDYKLTFTVKTLGLMPGPDVTFSSVNWPGADPSGVLSFTVAGDAADPTDPNAITSHPLPEQCNPPTM